MDDRGAAIVNAWEFIRTRAHGRVRIVADYAFSNEILRALYPFQSMNHLRFSTTCDYPYDSLPYISAEGPDGRDYEARDELNNAIAKGPLEVVVPAVADAIRSKLKSE